MQPVAFGAPPSARDAVDPPPPRHHLRTLEEEYDTTSVEQRYHQRMAAFTTTNLHADPTGGALNAADRAHDAPHQLDMHTATAAAAAGSPLTSDSHEHASHATSHDSSGVSTPIKRESDAYASTVCNSASSASSYSSRGGGSGTARPRTNASPQRSTTGAIEPFVLLHIDRASFVCILRRGGPAASKSQKQRGTSSSSTTNASPSKQTCQGLLCMREVQSKLLDALPQYRNRTEQSSRSSIRQELEKLHYVPLIADKAEISILKSKKVIKHNAPGTSLYSVSQVSHFLHYHDLDEEGAQLKRAFDEWRARHGVDLSDDGSEGESESAKERRKKSLKIKVDSASASTSSAIKQPKSKSKPVKHRAGLRISEDEDEEILSHATGVSARARARRPKREASVEPHELEDGDADEEETYASSHYSSQETIHPPQPPPAVEPPPPPITYTGHRRQRSHASRFSLTHQQLTSLGGGGSGSAVVVHEFEPLVEDAPHPSFSAPAPRIGSGWDRYHQRMHSLTRWTTTSTAGAGFGTTAPFGGVPLHAHHREPSLLPSGLELEALQAREARMWAESQYQTHAPAPLQAINPMIKLVMSPVSMQLATARSVMSPTSPLMGHALSLSPFGLISSPALPTDHTANPNLLSPPIGVGGGVGSSSALSSPSPAPVNNSAPTLTLPLHTGYKRPRLVSPSAAAAAAAAVKLEPDAMYSPGRSPPTPSPPGAPLSPAHHVHTTTTTTTTTTTLSPCLPGCQCHLHPATSSMSPPHQSPAAASTTAHLAAHTFKHAREHSGTMQHYQPQHPPPPQHPYQSAQMHSLHQPPPSHALLSVPAFHRRSLSVDTSELTRLSDSAVSDILVHMHAKR